MSQDKVKKRSTVGDFKPGNVASMTAGGAHGALRRLENGQEQRRDVLELKAERLQEFERSGRLGWLVDRLAELDALTELFWERAHVCYDASDIDGVYRASQEIRRLVKQMAQLVAEHRTEEGAAGRPVLDYEAIRAQMQGASDA